MRHLCNNGLGMVRFLTDLKVEKMIKENVLEIKKLVSDLHCMGTYGMVELELTKIESYVKELEGKVKNLTIPRVSNLTCRCGKPYSQKDLQDGMCHKCCAPTG